MVAIDKSALKIRRMVSSDIDTSLGIWWAKIPNKEMVSAQLYGPRDLSFMAEYGGHLVGFVLAAQCYAGMPMTAVGSMYLVAVNPDYQGQGIGTMLVEALKKHCKTRGIETVRAVISQSDKKNIKFFTSIGFSKSGILNYDMSSG